MTRLPARRLCAVGSGMNVESVQQPVRLSAPWLVRCPECGKTLDLNGGEYLPRHFEPVKENSR